MPSTVIRNADWVIAWDEAASRHVYRRGVDVAFADDRISFLGHRFTGAAERVIDGAGLMVMP
jgi:cytosine/adenosine deaminase-related metal-dependent hydrolase